jgi:hypothetical protein
LILHQPFHAHEQPVDFFNAPLQLETRCHHDLTVGRWNFARGVVHIDVFNTLPCRFEEIQIPGAIVPSNSGEAGKQLQPQCWKAAVTN